MNICIDKAKRWLESHPRTRQWTWLIILWLGGLLTVLAIAYPIKWFIRSIG